MFNDIIHNLVQNIATAIYAIRNCRCHPAPESQQVDDNQQEFWNSVVGRDMAERIEEYVRQSLSR